MTTYKPAVEVSGEPGTYHQNALVFATYQEAADNARDLSMRWMLVTNWRVDESMEPANYTYLDGKLKAIAS